MHGYPSVDVAANSLARLPLEQARARLSEIIDDARRVGYGEEYAKMLDFNARLVTCLRERKVRIWGVEPDAYDDEASPA